MGELRGLIYHCRRAPWLAPASYVHFFDRRPTLATDPAGRRLFIVGGCYRVTHRGIVG